MNRIEESLQKYIDREISTERLAEELGVNFYVLASALRRGCQLFKPQPDDSLLTDEDELNEITAAIYNWRLNMDGIKGLLWQHQSQIIHAKDKECQERVGQARKAGMKEVVEWMKSQIAFAALFKPRKIKRNDRVITIVDVPIVVEEFQDQLKDWGI